MKLIIAGSRTVHPDNVAINGAISDAFGAATLLRISEIVSGGANGADACGEHYAKAHGLAIKQFPANWDKHGKAAGKLRNREMADYADAALVFWDGMSSGSCDMVTRMVARGKPVRVVPMKAWKP